MRFWIVAACSFFVMSCYESGYSSGDRLLTTGDFPVESSYGHWLGVPMYMDEDREALIAAFVSAGLRESEACAIANYSVFLGAYVEQTGALGDEEFSDLPEDQQLDAAVEHYRDFSSQPGFPALWESCEFMFYRMEVLDEALDADYPGFAHSGYNITLHPLGFYAYDLTAREVHRGGFDSYFIVQTEQSSYEYFFVQRDMFGRWFEFEVSESGVARGYDERQFDGLNELLQFSDVVFAGDHFQRRRIRVVEVSRNQADFVARMQQSMPDLSEDPY